MKAPVILAVALLCACTQQPTFAPPPTMTPAEQRELDRIERACLAEQRRCPSRAMSCDWGGLDEARQWEARCPQG